MADSIALTGPRSSDWRAWPERTTKAARCCSLRGLSPRPQAGVDSRREPPPPAGPLGVGPGSGAGVLLPFGSRRSCWQDQLRGVPCARSACRCVFARSSEHPGQELPVPFFVSAASARVIFSGPCAAARRRHPATAATPCRSRRPGRRPGAGGRDDIRRRSNAPARRRAGHGPGRRRRPAPGQANRRPDRGGRAVLRRGPDRRGTGRRRYDPSRGLPGECPGCDAAV